MGVVGKALKILLLFKRVDACGCLGGHRRTILENSNLASTRFVGIHPPATGHGKNKLS